MNRKKIFNIILTSVLIGSMSTALFINPIIAFAETPLDKTEKVKVLEMDFNNNKAINIVDNREYQPVNMTANANANYVSSIKGNGYEPNDSKFVIPFHHLGITEDDSILTVSFLMKYGGSDTNFMPISIFGYGENDVGANNLWFYDGVFGFNTGKDDNIGIRSPFVDDGYYSIIAEFHANDVSKNKLYINGVKQDISYLLNTSSYRNGWNKDSSIGIGGFVPNTLYNISDKTVIDEVKIYKKSLTTDEINAVSKSHQIPELRTEVVNNKNVSVSWATEILQENLLWNAGFEENENRPSLSYSTSPVTGSNLGEQSFSPNAKYSGYLGYQLLDTYNGKGNNFLFPLTQSNSSKTTWSSLKNVIDRNMNLSISVRAKSTGNSTFAIGGQGGFETKLHNCASKLVKDVAKGDVWLYVDKLDPSWKVQADGKKPVGHYKVFPDESDDIIMQDNYIQEIDVENKKIKLAKSVYRNMKAGETLKYRNWINPFSGGSISMGNTNTWTLYNFNTVVTNNPYYDPMSRGFSLIMTNSTDKALYLDDLKLGYATKVKLYKNGNKVYEGYESEFNDTSAIDKASPNTVSNIKCAMDIDDNYNRNLNITFNASEDNGTSYNYNITSVDKNGVESPLSKTQTQIVTSGIKGYSYVIDKSSSTVPDNTVDTTNTSIKNTITDSGVYYVHIKAIDNAGNVSSVVHHKIDSPSLTAKAKPNDNMIRLDWTLSDPSNKLFKVFQKKEGSNEFQSISSTDVATTQQIKVLNIHPNVGEFVTYETWDGKTMREKKSASLKQWMEEPQEGYPKGYGMGIIEVDLVTQADFNKNPSSYLKNPDGTWKYDVVVNGFADANGEVDLTDEGVNVIREFVEYGKGYLCGHDTIDGQKYIINRRITNKLRDVLNVKFYPDIDGVSFIPNIFGEKLSIKKKGLLLNYPHQIGDIGSELTVPTSHSTGQMAYGDIWMTYSGGKSFIDESMTDGNGEGTNNFYLTTWNNTALIQTGHSNGKATSDEQKVLANTICYLNQLISDTFLNDYSGQDVKAPNKPTIYEHNFLGNGEVEFKFNEVEDNGSEYSYYVESKDGLGTVTFSDVVTETITTGLKGYSYEIDSNPDTIPDNSIDITKAGSLRVDMTNSNYIHIKAIDNVGNASDTLHYKILDDNPPNLNVYLESEDWTNEDVNIIVNAWDNDSESGIDRIVLPDGNIVKVEEGQSNINTNYITGNGTYIFEAYDKFGNKTTATITVNNVDRNSPNLEVYAESEEWTNRPVKLNISAWDNANESGIAKIKLPNGEFLHVEKGINRLDGEYYVEENGDYEFIAYDFAGNEKNLVYRVTWIDKDPPELELALDNYNWTDSGINIKATAWDGDNAVGIEKIKLPNGEFVFAGAGEYNITTFYPVTENETYTFEAYDKLGNKTTKNITVDNTDNQKPNLEVHIANTKPSKTVDIIVDAWDNDFGSGINKVKLPNGNFITPNVGENKIHNIYTVSKNGEYEFIAYDNAGNTTIKSIIITNIDDKSPSMTVTGNPTDWTNKDVILNISANDLESGLSYILLPNGNKVTTSTTTYTVSANGTYTFKAYDNVGNETVVNVVVNKIDKELPTINYTKEFNANKTSGYINLSVIDSLSGFAKLELPNGVIITSSTYKYPINENGMYLFSAWDKAGNKSILGITVSELNTNNAPSGISRIEYKLSGATVQDWRTYTAPFYITNEGITTITAKSYDLVGNVSNEVTSQVKIDKTKPINNGIEIKLK